METQSAFDRQRVKSQLMQQQVDLTHNVFIRRRQAIPRLATARQRSVSIDVRPSFTVGSCNGSANWCAYLVCCVVSS